MILNWVLEENCPLCGSKNISLSYAKVIPAPPAMYPDMPKYEPRALKLFYFECKDCGVFFMNPRHDQEAINHLYSTELYRDIMAQSREEMDAGELERAERLIEYIPHGVSLLDVGCGRGHLLRLAHDKGCKAVGIEPNDKYPMDNVVYIENYKAIVGKFDFVACIHTLEHLYDPGKMVGKLKEFTAPGGKIMIEVPREEARGESSGIVHPFYFSPEVIMDLFDDCELVMHISGPHEMFIFEKT